ncbi:hypothetical protein GGX14DRAFT_402239 [Mycena pura]|uniref:Uncharacterized protein n=1 Tax=Mycena pura TaxID=153505 RepID=A0AAD6V2E8_9AGAR|nr:hypothetical protein GGX14DRAFT_402239 [Mycena pura]
MYTYDPFSDMTSEFDPGGRRSYRAIAAEANGVYRCRGGSWSGKGNNWWGPFRDESPSTRCVTCVPPSPPPPPVGACTLFYILLKKARRWWAVSGGRQNRTGGQWVAGSGGGGIGGGGGAQAANGGGSGRRRRWAEHRWAAHRLAQAGDGGGTQAIEVRSQRGGERRTGDVIVPCYDHDYEDPRLSPKRSL